MQKLKGLEGWLRTFLLIAILFILVAPVSMTNMIKTTSANTKTQDMKDSSTTIVPLKEGNVKDGSRGTYTIHTLADGSTKKNLTFTAAGNITDAFSIPRNATVVSATMDLTGYPVNLNPTFRDDFNDGDLAGWTVSTQGSGLIQNSGSQYHSAPDSMRMYSPPGTSSLAMATNQVIFNPATTDYNVSFYFRLTTTTNHWFDVFVNTPQILTVIDTGNQFSYRYGTTNVVIMTLITNNWYHIRYFVHVAQSNYDIYVDSTYKTTAPFCGGGGNPQTFTVGDTETGSSNYGEAFWDDFVITPWVMSDDFNDNNLNGWTITTLGSGSVQPSAAQYVSSPYSMRMYSPSSPASEAMATYTMSTLDTTKNYNVSLYFRLPYSTNHWFDVFTNPPQTTTVIDTSNNYRWYDGSSAHQITALTVNVWYHIELKVHPSLNSYDIYINNVFQTTATFCGGGGNAQIFRIGDFESGSSNYGEGYWDDFVVVQPPTILSYPLNPSLDVGNDGDLQWSHAGTFTTKETTPDFAAEVNQYLGNQPPGSGNITVPLKFHSGSAGKLEISNIAITYTLNQPPSTPSCPSGQTSINAGKTYTYQTSTTDPDNDQIFYKWNWCNNQSGWLGPYNSGATATATYKWVDQGTFTVTVKAKDTYGHESGWSQGLTVHVTPVSSDWEGNTKVTNDSYASQSPSIANDSAGNLHLVWQDNRDGNWEIYYKKLDNNGNQLVADTRLTSNGASSESPCIGIDQTNNIHIVWQDYRDSNWEIYYTKLNNTGATLVDDTRITNNIGDSLYPALKLSTIGNIHIAWQDYRDSNWEIYYKKLNNSGAALTTDTRMTTQTAASQHPSIGTYIDTLANLAWQDNRDGNYEIYLKDAALDLRPISIIYTNPNGPADHQHLAIVGQTLNINVVVANYGHITVSNARVDVLCDTTQIWTGYVSIGANTTATLPPITWIPTQQGRHTLNVSIDPEHQLSDLDPTNNILVSYLPIVDPGNVHDTPWSITSPFTPPSGTIHACKQLSVYSSGSLTLENSDVITFGSSQAIQIQGGLSAHNTIITSSYPSEYLTTFELAGTAPIEITGCDISQLGIDGMTINRPNPIIFSGNKISNSFIAINCQQGVHTIDNNTILNSAQYDFSISTIAQLYVVDSFFDINKIHTDATSVFDYKKHVILNFIDENDQPANHSFVRINNSLGQTVFSGYTNTTGYLLPQLLQVYQINGGQTNFSTPFTFTAVNQQSGSFFSGNMNFGGGLLNPGMGGFGGNFKLYWVHKYALLTAGVDSTASDQQFDRLTYWDDTEYMYHVLKDIKGYKPENIKVFFMDGKDGFGHANAIITNRSNQTNIHNALREIGSKMKNDESNRDTLFIYCTDHGDPLPGSATAKALDMTDGTYLADYVFGNWINTSIGANASKIYVVMNPCFSGGFIDNLHAFNRVIQTAVLPSELSKYYYWNDYPTNGHQTGHSRFSVEYISAFHNHQAGVGTYPDVNLSNYPTDDEQLGTYPRHKNPLQGLDDDNNGLISFHEAFDYALDHDLRGPVAGDSAEHPQEVDGDIMVVAGSSGRLLLEQYDGDSTVSGKTLFPTGVFKKVVVADLNNDGYDDIVLTEIMFDKVVVMLNKGNWTFTTYRYDGGYDPEGLCVVDLNKDTYPDVACTNWGDGDISIFFNQQNGTLGGRTDYKVGQWPNRVASKDFDNDGDIDLVVTNELSQNFSVLFNKGQGTFYPPKSFAIAGYPTGVATEDIDNDSDNDILVSVQEDQIAVYTNEQTIPHLISQDMSQPIQIATADIDKDGKKDVVALGGTSPNWYLTWFKNNNLQQWPGYYIAGSFEHAYSFSVGDIDNDGDPDVVAQIENTIKWFENKNSGLTWTEHVVNDTAQGTPFTVVVKDMDGDGNQDVVTSINEYPERIAWYDNQNGNGNVWVEHNISIYTDIQQTDHLFPVDVDGDGDMDVVCSSINSYIFWTENKGNNNWDRQMISSTSGVTSSLFAADLNGDSHVDVIAACGVDNKIAWYQNDGSGDPAFWHWYKYYISTSSMYVNSIYAADFNKDSKIDVFSASYSDDTIAWYKNQISSVPAWRQYNISKTADGAFCVVADDLNNDNMIDVVSSSLNDHKINWYEHVNATFVLSRTITGCSWPVRILLEDLNKDNKKELIVVNDNSDNIQIYTNPGNGAYTLARTLLFGTMSGGQVIATGPSDVFVTDLDGDEDLDLVATTSNPAGLWVFLNTAYNNPASMNYARGIQTEFPWYIWPCSISGINHNDARRWYP